MRVHELKIYKKYCDELTNGTKSFEIRKNDRNFQVGDILHLRETKNNSDIYTGYEMFGKITHIHQGLGMQEGYVCMAITNIHFY